MRKEKKTEITKERIIQAAMQEFGKNGYEASTLNAICNDYNISKGLLYHNFKGKDELYLICVEKCFSEVTAYLQTQEIKDDLRTYMKTRFRYFSENPLCARIFFEAVLQPPSKLRSEIIELKAEFDLLNKSVYRSVLSKMTLREGITEKQALEYYGIMQDMFNGYFSSQVFLKDNISSVIEEHEKRLAKVLDYMLYGIAKRREE